MGNELADREANAARGLGGIDMVVAPSVSQLRLRTHQMIRNADIERHKKEAFGRGAEDRPSASCHWWGIATGYTPLRVQDPISRRLEVILYRMRLGYMTGWERTGTATTGATPDCPCGTGTNNNTLAHYLAECPSTELLRRGPATSPPALARRLCERLTTDNIKAKFLVENPPPR